MEKKKQKNLILMARGLLVGWKNTTKSVDLRNYLISIFYSIMNKVGPTGHIRYERVKEVSPFLLILNLFFIKYFIFFIKDE